jgi:hypothetical protein
MRLTVEFSGRQRRARIKQTCDLGDLLSGAVLVTMLAGAVRS